MKITSFNVNGLRSIKSYYAEILNLSFEEFLLHILKSEIICFQETKMSKIEVGFDTLASYDAFFAFNKSHRKIGYSGVATYCKSDCKYSVQAVEDGFSGIETKSEGSLNFYGNLHSKFTETRLKELDSEGRCIITDHGLFVLFNVYFPNDGQENLESRLQFKMDFYRCIQLRVEAFTQSGRFVILCGDFNATYHPIDHYDFAKEYLLLEKMNKDETDHISKAAITRHVNSFYAHPPRQWFKQFLDGGRDSGKWIDVFRKFHPDAIDLYSCWNLKLGSKKSNMGSRIDYFVVDEAFIDLSKEFFGSGHLDEKVVKNCEIAVDILGSDHAPIIMELDIEFLLNIWDTYFSSFSGTVKSNLPKSISTIKQSRIDHFFRKRECNSPEKSPEKKPRRIEQHKELLSVVTSTAAPKLDDRWSQLFKQKKAPKCTQHQEECKMLRVNKQGINKGRYFYTCSRNPGSSRDKEGRCNFFEWATK